MTKAEKRIRYDLKMAKRRTREAELRVPSSKTPEEAVASLALRGIAKMNLRLLIDAANIRAKRRAEALKNSGLTSLPVPPLGPLPTDPRRLMTPIPTTVPTAALTSASPTPQPQPPAATPAPTPGAPAPTPTPAPPAPPMLNRYVKEKAT